MDNIIISTALRGIAIYALGLLLARLMERKLVSQMTFFDFIIGVSIGSLIANAIIGASSKTLSALTGLIMLSVLSIATSFIHITSFKARKLVNS